MGRMGEQPILDPERAQRFIWEVDDVEWLTPEQAIDTLGAAAFMPQVTRELVRLLSERAREVGIGKINEKHFLQPLLLDVLRAELDPAWVLAEQNGQVPDWIGKLGGVDVVVTHPEGGGHRFLMELKWCHDPFTLGWTLWDAYKMAAARRREGVEGCYLVVGAPFRIWHEDCAWCCADLFADGTWNSADLFRRYWLAWLHLLGGGTARPTRVATEIETRLIAEEGIAAGGEPWSLRVLAVEPMGDEWLRFERDWPEGCRPTPEQVVELNTLSWTPMGALVCAECRAKGIPDTEGWRYLDGDGTAVRVCPECAKREVGSTSS
jgi:hypothetical protein